MKTQLSETASQVLHLVKSEIAALKEKLSASCLDGTPMLVIAKFNGVERVYGEWYGKRGFISSELVPPTLCGCVMMSPENATSNVRILNDAGTSAYFVHWRQFAEVRIAKLSELEQALTTSNLPVA